MRARCLNPKNTCYDRYGGRGIMICAEWLDSFDAFRSWSLENDYIEGHSIDRINNDGNYEPGNCQWVTMDVQALNKSNNRILVAFGESKPMVEWARDARCSVSGKTIRDRLESGYSVEEAISFPKGTGPRRKKTVSDTARESYRKANAARKRNAKGQMA